MLRKRCRGWKDGGERARRREKRQRWAGRRRGVDVELLRACSRFRGRNSAPLVGHTPTKPSQAQPKDPTSTKQQITKMSKKRKETDAVLKSTLTFTPLTCSPRPSNGNSHNCPTGLNTRTKGGRPRIFPYLGSKINQ